MMGFMIYFVINMRFFKIFKVFKVFLKSGPSLEKWGKMGGNTWPRIPIYILLGRLENIVRIGENASYRYFLLFRLYFEKASFQGSFKVGTVW